MVRKLTMTNTPHFMKFSTSWDDGYALDLRLADLLARYGFHGTFYPCPVPQMGQTMLVPDDIRSLSQRFEIGAHTLSHPRLTTQTPEIAEQELSGSKQWIEDCTGKPCSMFCYPKGDWNPSVRALVHKAGFAGARTTDMLQFSLTDRFAMPTSLHLYPFPLRRRWTRLSHVLDPFPWQKRYGKRFAQLHVPLSAKFGWLPLAQHLFRYAAQSKQPFFHLWGHSAEIERFGLWKDLERFLIFVREYGAEIDHVPNSTLLPTTVA